MLPRFRHFLRNIGLGEGKRRREHQALGSFVRLALRPNGEESTIDAAAGIQCHKPFSSGRLPISSCERMPDGSPQFF
jgi:hypothetical protein